MPVNEVQSAIFQNTYVSRDASLNNIESPPALPYASSRKEKLNPKPTKDSAATALGVGILTAGVLLAKLTLGFLGIYAGLKLAKVQNPFKKAFLGTIAAEGGLLYVRKLVNALKGKSSSIISIATNMNVGQPEKQTELL